jgi:hypothetical protein
MLMLPLGLAERAGPASYHTSQWAFSASFTPPYRLVDILRPLHCTIISLANVSPRLRLLPRRSPVEQCLFERPHMICQARRHHLSLESYALPP